MQALLFVQTVCFTPFALHRADGYPSSLSYGQILRKLSVRDVLHHGVAGRYVCLYEGQGSIDLKFDAKVVSRGKGRIDFDFVPTGECPEP